ncbi:tyrosine-type recombinase/integrase [Roseateles sp. BYS78W]|uniref:Tyrosine-type recombinase/integrase n=1 Tax=Pelomonas candidula TaxID=3299025 RepID=A0ABW7H8K5_9BURK
MAEAYRVATGWAIRPQIGGERVYLDGFSTKTAAEKEARRLLCEYEDRGAPKHAGPHKTTLAKAMQLYGLERLPFLKGAEQEANRINKVLRAAGERVLSVKRIDAPTPDDIVRAAENKETPEDSPPKKGALFKVELKSAADSAKRAIPKGLHQHRQGLATKTLKSDKCRTELAKSKVADITRHQVQELMDALRSDGLSASSLQLERATLRVFFYHAAASWNWTVPAQNPATKLKMPSVDNGRDRVMSEEEQERLESALEDCRNKMVPHILTLLRETAMRSSEPLQQAKWCDVQWERNVLHLDDGKAGQRDVPLSPLAVRALREMQAMQPGAHPRSCIVNVSYEALKAAWKRACERAGVDGLNMHDLRHTAATRLMLKTGNMSIVQALTGHKTLSQLGRYINVKADDVVKVLHAEPLPPNPPAASSPTPQRITPVIDSVEGNVVRLQLAQGRAA